MHDDDEQIIAHVQRLRNHSKAIKKEAKLLTIHSRGALTYDLIMAMTYLERVEWSVTLMEVHGDDDGKMVQEKM